MRHGARTPADTYPNDPYLNYNFYPVGWGQLTNVSKPVLNAIVKFETRKELDLKPLDLVV